DLYTGARHLDGDRAVLAVEGLFRRGVADDVIGAGVALDLVQRLAEVVLVADREAPGIDREAVRAVGLVVELLLRADDGGRDRLIDDGRPRTAFVEAARVDGIEMRARPGGHAYRLSKRGFLIIEKESFR